MTFSSLAPSRAPIASLRSFFWSNESVSSSASFLLFFDGLETEADVVDVLVAFGAFDVDATGCGMGLDGRFFSFFFFSGGGSFFKRSMFARIISIWVSMVAILPEKSMLVPSHRKQIGLTHGSARHPPLPLLRRRRRR